MKKIILTLAIICMAAAGSIAQSKPGKTATWVIESNLNTPGTQTVRFYDNDMHLIYSETIQARLNVSKRKVQQKLNDMLIALMANGKPTNDNNIIAASLAPKRH